MPETLYEIWGRNIRIYCDAKGWTQADLAVQLDPPTTQATVSRWMSGHAAPRDDVKLKIADLFGVPPVAIFPLVKVPA